MADNFAPTPDQPTGFAATRAALGQANLISAIASAAGGMDYTTKVDAILKGATQAQIDAVLPVLDKALTDPKNKIPDYAGHSVFEQAVQASSPEARDAALVQVAGRLQEDDPTHKQGSFREGIAMLKTLDDHEKYAAILLDNGAQSAVATKAMDAYKKDIYAYQDPYNPQALANRQNREHAEAEQLAVAAPALVVAAQFTTAHESQHISVREEKHLLNEILGTHLTDGNARHTKTIAAENEFKKEFAEGKFAALAGNEDFQKLVQQFKLNGVSQGTVIADNNNHPTHGVAAAQAPSQSTGRA